MKPTIAMALAASAFLTPATRAEGVEDAPAKPARAAYLAVAYADTLQGMLAKLAVASCARAEAPAAVFEIRETAVTSEQDIVVRMIDADDHEISRTVGSAAVCQYGRFAAAYFDRTRHPSNENTR